MRTLSCWSAKAGASKSPRRVMMSLPRRSGRNAGGQKTFGKHCELGEKKTRWTAVDRIFLSPCVSERLIRGLPAIEPILVTGGIYVDEVEERAGGNVGGDVGPLMQVSRCLDV